MPETIADEAALTLTLFGPFQVQLEGRPLPSLRSRKALWLLALLVLRHDRPVEREWLAGTLWPDVVQDRAQSALRPVLSELRQALGSQRERLQSPNRHSLRLDLKGAAVDILAFDAAITRGTLSSLAQAAALYHGPLLEGVAEEWVVQDREIREQDCLRALQKLAELAASAGDTAAATNYWRRAVGIDPFWETARRGLMEMLAASGDVNAALLVYREFVAHIQSDPKAAPDAQTSVLYQRLREEARRRASAKPPATGTATVVCLPDEAATPPAASVSGYLPHPLTELVGREDEAADIIAALRRRSRLVTLTGPGGTGKTRLAVEVAARIAGDFSDGAWFVSLESLSDPDLVPQAIASVLGVQEEAGNTPLLQTLADFLKTRRLLLILDNCEHLLEASARVIGYLLQECSGLRVLATSRETLGITGETVWAVPPLSIPDPAHLPAGRSPLVRVLSGYDGVRLFVERAQAVQKNFALTAANAPAVAQICFRVEGLPLALELAAARVRAMSVEQIAERLGERLSGHLDLLGGGGRARYRTSTARQQTLRATLDWSYDLLTEREQVLLHRLSVFAGGWTLEAAERVCASDAESDVPLKELEILDLLTSLTDKSLVVFGEREADGNGRYCQPEILRQYAAERLQTSGEAKRIRDRHRGWCLALAEEAAPQLRGSDQEIWLRRLETEHDNLRAAFEGIADAPEAGMRMATALVWFWYVRAHYGEGRTYLERVLALRQDISPTAEARETRAKALNAGSILAHLQGDNARSQEWIEECLDLYRQQGNWKGIADAMGNLGNIKYSAGDNAAAQSLYQEALALYREIEDHYQVAITLGNLANLAHQRSDFAAERALNTEALRLFQQWGDKRGEAWELFKLGKVARTQNDLAEAQALSEESLAVFREIEDRLGIAWSLFSLGDVAMDRRDKQAADPLYEESLARFREIGEQRGIGSALERKGRVAQGQKRYAVAQSFYEESRNTFQTIQDEDGLAGCLINMGSLAYAQGNLEPAWALYTQSLHTCVRLGDRWGVLDILEGFASILTTQPGADAEKAARLWGAEHSLRKTLGIIRSAWEQEGYESLLAQNRATLSADAFTRAWDEGGAMDWKQAAACAIEETGAA